jgi:outer membrane protein assembly factor BamE (lipoprotein component of BamABCDE complex)
MRHRYSLLLFLAFAGTARVSRAQATIDPGMTKAQVIEKLGKPVTQRTTGTSTFLFYRNGEERKVGMNDIVTLESDKVTDAVFRSRARKYSGTSSSPSAISSATAIKTGKTASTPPLKIAAPTPAAAATPKPATKALPAAAAKAQDVARPMPQARSAIREKEKEAATKAAEPRPADPAAATDPKKPADPKAPVDPKAPPAKKP